MPDFEADKATIDRYEEARTRFMKRAASDAESRVRSEFSKKREAIRSEISVLNMQLQERKVAAGKHLREYASRYPHRMEKNKPRKPSFWENFLSLGGAGRYYRKTVEATEAATEASALCRRRENDEELLVEQEKRALFLSEDSIKKKIASPEGLAEFHAKPGIDTLLQRVVAIKQERATYADRVTKGEVSSEEMRDRLMAEHHMTYTEAPMTNVIIASFIQMGNLAYWVFRDTEKKESLFPFDPRLDMLTNYVIDVFRIGDKFEAKLARTQTGVLLTPLEHYLALYKDDELARQEYRRARIALKGDRTNAAVNAPTDVAAQALLELLVGLARASEREFTPAQPPLTP